MIAGLEFLRWYIVVGCVSNRRVCYSGSLSVARVATWILCPDRECEKSYGRIPEVVPSQEVAACLECFKGVLKARKLGTSLCGVTPFGVKRTSSEVYFSREGVCCVSIKVPPSPPSKKENPERRPEGLPFHRVCTSAEERSERAPGPSSS